MNLNLKQSYPLEMKVLLTKKRIEEFANIVGWDKIYISFSGGKDSTVLLNIARQLHNFPAVFCDTGLEYPEIKSFVRTIDNVEIIKPKISFRNVIEKYGYPVISKETSQRIAEYRNTKSNKLRELRLNQIAKKWKFLLDAPFNISDRCCYFLKKYPFKKYEKQTGKSPLIGVMAEESSLRIQSYNKYGCILNNQNKKQCRPIMFWTENDIWKYIKINNISYSKIYDNGMPRTGCMFCLFGIQNKNDNRLVYLETNHKKIYNYLLDKLNYKNILNFLKNKGIIQNEN
jgi:3'-phosphoadenosine 5'-phosphosulfate sulfotransferase (PAPS reductase)/FAD synthetase